MADSCITIDCVQIDCVEIPDEECEICIDGTCTTTTGTVTVVNNNTGGCIDTTGVITIASDCDCCVSISLLEGDANPTCPQIGDKWVYEITGCNCECECGPAGWYYKSGKLPPVCIVQSDDVYGGVTTLTIGPLKSTQKFEIGLACDEIKCPECC